jgi:hypothetical protein
LEGGVQVPPPEMGSGEFLVRKGFLAHPKNKTTKTKVRSIKPKYLFLNLFIL